VSQAVHSLQATYKGVLSLISVKSW